MQITGRIFNQTLPRGSQWMDIQLNVPLENMSKDYNKLKKELGESKARQLDYDTRTNKIMHEDITKLIQTWTDEAAFDDKLAAEAAANNDTNGDTVLIAIAKARAG